MIVHCGTDRIQARITIGPAGQVTRVTVTPRTKAGITSSDLRDISVARATASAAATEHEPPMRFQRPGGRAPDDFYQGVADAFLWLIAAGSHRPAAELASRNGLPVTTVHRWVKEARRRGLLGNGER